MIQLWCSTRSSLSDWDLSPATLLSSRVLPPRSLDASEALACPGVVDVITAEDVPGDNNHSGEIFYAQDEVRDLCVVCDLILCSSVKIDGCGSNI